MPRWKSTLSRSLRPSFAAAAHRDRPGLVRGAGCDLLLPIFAGRLFRDDQPLRAQPDRPDRHLLERPEFLGAPGQRLSGDHHQPPRHRRGRGGTEPGKFAGLHHRGRGPHRHPHHRGDGHGRRPRARHGGRKRPGAGVLPLRREHHAHRQRLHHRRGAAAGRALGPAAGKVYHPGGDARGDRAPWACSPRSRSSPRP